MATVDGTAERVAPSAAAVDSSAAKTLVTTQTKRQRFKRAAIRVAIALGVVGLAYGIGRLQGYLTERRLVEQHTAAQESGRREVDQARANVERERLLSYRLEARRRLHLALLALDERNFGIAQGYLKQAAALLSRTRPTPGSELAALTDQLSNLQLRATEDLGLHRERVLGLVRSFDRLVPPHEPAP